MSSILTLGYEKHLKILMG